MRFPHRPSASLASLLAVSGTVVGGAALLRSGPVDASVENVVCAEQPVEADDRLRVNLATLEDVLARIGPEDGRNGNGHDRRARDGCASDDRTGVDVAPPARLGVRIKNLETGPVAEVETKQVQEDIDQVVADAGRIVGDTRDRVLDDASGTLDGASTQTSVGVTQTLSDTYGQLPEEARELLDSVNGLIPREAGEPSPGS